MYDITSNITKLAVLTYVLSWIFTFLAYYQSSYWFATALSFDVTSIITLTSTYFIERLNTLFFVVVTVALILFSLFMKAAVLAIFMDFKEKEKFIDEKRRLLKSEYPL